MGEGGDEEETAADPLHVFALALATIVELFPPLLPPPVRSDGTVPRIYTLNGYQEQMAVNEAYLAHEGFYQLFGMLRISYFKLQRELERKRGS